jgi:preprotein translocase subunit SecY
MPNSLSIVILALLYTLGLFLTLFWARRRTIWARKVAAEMASQGGG